jgi:hypothetical protein
MSRDTDSLPDLMLEVSLCVDDVWPINDLGVNGHEGISGQPVIQTFHPSSLLAS